MPRSKWPNNHLGGEQWGTTQRYLKHFIRHLKILVYVKRRMHKVRLLLHTHLYVLLALACNCQRIWLHLAVDADNHMQEWYISEHNYFLWKSTRRSQQLFVHLTSPQKTPDTDRIGGISNKLDLPFFQQKTIYSDKSFVTNICRH